MKIDVKTDSEILEFRYWEMYSRAYIQYAIAFLLPSVDPGREREVFRLNEFLKLKIPLIYFFNYQEADEAAKRAKIRLEKDYKDLMNLAVVNCRKIVRNPDWEPKKIPFSWNDFFWKSVENEDLVYPPADVPSFDQPSV